MLVYKNVIIRKNTGLKKKGKQQWSGQRGGISTGTVPL